MQINGRDFVAIYYEKDKEVGVAQVSYGNGKWLYGTIAVVGTRSDTKTFKDCVDLLEESIQNHWCLIWMTDNEVMERFKKIDINIDSIEHVDLYELTEKVNYESNTSQR